MQLVESLSDEKTASGEPRLGPEDSRCRAKGVIGAAANAEIPPGTRGVSPSPTTETSPARSGALVPGTGGAAEGNALWPFWLLAAEVSIVGGGSDGRMSPSCEASFGCAAPSLRGHLASGIIMYTEYMRNGIQFPQQLFLCHELFQTSARLKHPKRPAVRDWEASYTASGVKRSGMSCFDVA